MSKDVVVSAVVLCFVLCVYTSMKCQSTTVTPQAEHLKRVSGSNQFVMDAECARRLNCARRAAARVLISEAVIVRDGSHPCYRATAAMQRVRNIGINLKLQCIDGG